ncbi:Zn-dependent hydrolase [Geminicoccaceae bacterium 1502E]|nr:Zn-dependent hydrolase [Geminicoccaceae bacterium 1502E]
MILAGQLFRQLADLTADGPGITRESYGQGEQSAHSLIQEAGRDLQLEVDVDPVGNTYVTLPGKSRSAPKILTGSHLDSVRQGGNFDGAAGVISGLSALSGMKRAGFTPSQDVSVMAVRAEEGCWFPETWLGSRMALGSLPVEMLDTLLHVDTGRSLAEHMTECGFRPDLVREGRRFLVPEEIACFLEVHIEQGPVLAAEGLPLGIVTAIMGGPRYRNGRITGAYAHAGGTPRAYRRDSVVALGQLIAGLDEYWRGLDDNGTDAVVTFGMISTDPVLHSFSRVPGEARFCLDVRVAEERVKTEVRDTLAAIARKIEREHNVEIIFGADSGPRILPMDRGIQEAFAQAAADRGIPLKSMPSGAGHDAGAFIEKGIPTAMLFIRNENGSHNPDEAMEMEDFHAATQTLVDFITSRSG